MMPALSLKRSASRANSRSESRNGPGLPKEVFWQPLGLSNRDECDLNHVTDRDTGSKLKIVIDKEPEFTRATGYDTFEFCSIQTAFYMMSPSARAQPSRG